MIEAVREVTEEQQGIRLAMEVWMRRQEEKERKWEKGKGKEKEKELNVEKTDEEKTEKKTGKEEIKIWRMGMEEKMRIKGWRTEMGVRPPPLHKKL